MTTTLDFVVDVVTRIRSLTEPSAYACDWSGKRAEFGEIWYAMVRWADHVARMKGSRILDGKCNETQIGKGEAIPVVA